MTAFLAFILALNLLICWWNCRITGKVWDSTKGRLYHVVTWCGFLQGCFGFSWCFLILEGLLYQKIFPFGIGGTELQPSVYTLTAYGFEILIKMGYVVFGAGLILTGFVIWIDSLIQAWRTKSLAGFAIGGWNTYAQISNTYHYAQAVGGFGSEIAEFFADAFKGNGKDKDDAKAGLAMLVIVLFVLAAVGGFAAGTLIMTNARAKERRVLAAEAATVRIGQPVYR